MPSSTFLEDLVDKSKHAFYAFAGVKVGPTTSSSAEDLIPDSVFDGLVSSNWEQQHHDWNGLGVTHFRRILFWIAVGLVILLFGTFSFWGPCHAVVSELQNC